MFRSVLTLRTTPENAERILELYRKEAVLQQSLDLTRQLSSDIVIAADGSGEVIVTAEWPDENGYQEWIDHPRRALSAPGLEDLLVDAEIGIGRLYRVDHRVERAS